MNLMKVVVQLGQARDMGSFPNPLADIDDVRPVLRVKVSDSERRNQISSHRNLPINSVMSMSRSLRMVPS
jgi:hypothetical protein